MLRPKKTTPEQAEANRAKVADQVKDLKKEARENGMDANKFYMLFNEQI